MRQADAMTERFELHRSHLRAVAYRMLGSTSEADDAVQEAWLRLARAGTGDIENLGGWLTTVVSRVCLDMLRARSSRREDPLGDDRPAPVAAADHRVDPEHEAILADAVGDAMRVVLDTLSPAERVAFVLHDSFGVPFEEIARILDRSPAATRKLASRARERVQGATPAAGTDRDRLREIVSAFLAAARDAEFDALLALLDPEVMVRADRAAAEMGAWELRGATAVARRFSGAARAARLALVDGVPAAVWAQGGTPRVVFAFTLRDGRIVAIDLIADPDYLAGIEVAFVRR